MKCSKNILYAYSFFLIISVAGMDSIQLKSNQCKIKTSDGKVCQLPQWQIEMSRTLHQQQALHCRLRIPDSLPLVVKTIDQEKLMLFSAALEAENFDLFFDRLNACLKNKLLCVVGEQELACPILTLMLLPKYIPLHIIKKNMDPDFAYIIDTVKQQIILDNFENKHIIQKPCNSYLEERCYASKSYQSFLECNSYDTLPEILQEKTNFNGEMLPAVIRLSEESQDVWLINNQANRRYIITPTEPVDLRDPFAQTRSIERYKGNANQKYLWAFMNNEMSLQKTLALTNPIENTLFSNDGTYLVMWSGNELVLTTLVEKNKLLTCDNLFLTEHNTGKVKTVCFNQQSTLCAYASDDTIYLWDMHSKQRLKTLSLPGQDIHCVAINNLDNRMITIGFDTKTGNYILALFDCTEINKIERITHFSFSSSPVTYNSLFTPCGNKILVREKQMTTIIDALSGKVIAHVEPHEDMNISDHIEFSILVPNTNILIAGSDKLLVLNSIDSHKNKPLVLEDKSFSGRKMPLCGIGCTSTGRTAVVLYRGFKMIEIELFNEETLKNLTWMSDNLSLIQKYLLLRLYHKRHSDDTLACNINPVERNILDTLPIQPSNVKAMVEKYLLKK